MPRIPTSRLRVTIRGAVQGVGFRPFIYRLANEVGLTGWVNNSPQGVFIEVEGEPEKLAEFLLRIEREKPPRAFIQSLESSFLDPVGFAEFTIRASDSAGAKSALVLPDIAVCADCLNDISDATNRRYRYPFTNCTNCGPRFSIIESLPYDRANTMMKQFAMCDECAAEYRNPLDRRFHAQPNACPHCGPHLELWNGAGHVLATHDQALRSAASALRKGAIVAVKGLGGFHLLTDARNDEAVQTLRERKHREEKPFAVMFPSLATIKEQCEVSALEQRLLLSPEAPIVLLKRRAVISNLKSQISNRVAPSNPYLGAMLPYTPLHHLLLNELQFAVVATSGNLSDEPICIDEYDALDQLSGIADFFLIHNRPIARHVDDSIVRVMAGRELVLRRARGFAPLPIHLTQTMPPLLAVGAHLKNTIAVAVGADAFVSQHIGDLETVKAHEAFQQVIASFQQLYEIQPTAITCDAHPDYLSTQFAQRSALRTHRVQHHFAHVMSCLAENEIAAPALGVAWDGTGYGLDGTIWGGEFLHVTNGSFERVAHFRTFRLPGGEAAVREPRRIALGLLYEIFGDDLFAMRELAPIAAFAKTELQLLRQMLTKQINAPLTSSAGRLFDAVAALVNLRQITRYEGQGAMELEFALDIAFEKKITTGNTGRAKAESEDLSLIGLPLTQVRFPVNPVLPVVHSEIIYGIDTDECYPLQLRDDETKLIVDWEPMIRALIKDVRADVPVNTISARFHNAMVESIVAVAARIGEEKIALTGGCFQNKYLTERAVQRLQAEGFRPYWHQRIPPNDGGIALGQLVAAARQLI